MQIDAALDATNLSRVAWYVRSNTRAGRERQAQGIVISLKDAFYQMSDTLIGVTKNFERTGSAVYTSDLSVLGEPQE
jgi:structural maintenance of chromosome 1